MTHQPDWAYRALCVALVLIVVMVVVTAVVQ